MRGFHARAVTLLRARRLRKPGKQSFQVAVLAARLLVAAAMLAIAVLPWQRQIGRTARVALLALSLVIGFLSAWALRLMGLDPGMAQDAAKQREG